MKKIILFVIFVAIGIFIISKYSDHNLKKTISSCVIAQKRISKSLDPQKAKKYCEKEVRKQKED